MQDKEIGIEVLCNADRTMFHIVIMCEEAMDNFDVQAALKEYVGSLDDNDEDGMLQ